MTGLRQCWPTLALAIVWPILAGGCDPKLPPVDLLVENVTVYPVTGDAPVSGTVAIRDGKFVAITTSGGAEYDAKATIDGSGKYLVPGLWDAHAHVRSSKERHMDVSRFFAAGVTSIHDLGGYLERMQALQRDLAAGTTAGPTIYPAYFMLNGESFADYQHVTNTETDVAAAIDALANAGAAQVKVHRALSPDVLPVVVHHSRERGLRVTGHIPLGTHPLDACRQGMAGIEHVGSFVEALVSVGPGEAYGSRQALEYLLSDAAQPIYDCLAENAVTVTPTLVIYPAIANRRAQGEAWPQEFVDFIESMKQFSRRLHDAGVPLLVGTDTSDLEGSVEVAPGAAVLDEMQMLEDAGIPTLAVLRMATRNPAEAIGAGGHSGSIEPGKAADFLLLFDDPGETVRNLRSLDRVFKGGELVYASEL